MNSNLSAEEWGIVNNCFIGELIQSSISNQNSLSKQIYEIQTITKNIQEKIDNIQETLNEAAVDIDEDDENDFDYESEELSEEIELPSDYEEEEYESSYDGSPSRSQ